MARQLNAAPEAREQVSKVSTEEADKPKAPKRVYSYTSPAGFSATRAIVNVSPTESLLRLR